MVAAQLSASRPCFKLADAIERRVAAVTARAERLTQAILAKAFRGELVPTEAELARRENRPYEPAAALLSRIRAERAAHTGPARKTGRRKPSDDARIALIARIIHRLHARPHFGTTQLAKALYLAQSHVGIDLAADFHRLSAGPLWKGMYPLRNRAKSKGYFDWTPPQGKGELECYQPGPNIAAPLQAGRTLVGDREPEFDRLLDLLGGLDTEQAEILATCYALWNDSLLDGRPPTDKQIIREFRTNWHPTNSPNRRSWQPRRSASSKRRSRS